MVGFGKNVENWKVFRRFMMNSRSGVNRDGHGWAREFRKNRHALVGFESPSKIAVLSQILLIIPGIERGWHALTVARADIQAIFCFNHQCRTLLGDESPAEQQRRCCHQCQWQRGL